MKRAVCSALLGTIAAVSTLPATAFAANVDFADHTVEGVSPAGTTINLFDYWIETQTASDNGKSDWLTGNDFGINKDHKFKFVFGGQQNEKNPGLNDWSGPKNGPVTGIVNNKLEDNMPRLSDANGGESLAYLFDPVNTSAQDYRAAYRGVTNLLQVDDAGYYYYNSMANFASFDVSSKAFTLYDAPAVASHSNNNAIPTGQFFPFNTAEQVFDSNQLGKDGHLLNKGASLDGRNKGIINTDASLNHWFGLTMSTRFVQPKKGFVDDYETTPMTYEFSGDDDVWIFIDGVLVGDLGGIHDPNRIVINFQTGEVKTYKKLTDDNKNGEEITEQKTTIKQAFNKAGVSGRFRGETFEDGTYHTLKFFYLERGNYASNMNLRFNLVTVPESQIVKVDQVGNPLSGVGFELYGQVKDENGAWTDSKDTLVAKGETDDNGELVLTDPQSGDPISFDAIYSRAPAQNGGYTRYRLHEVKQLDGYRSAGDMYLEYHPAADKGEFGGYVTSEQNNIWATGAYASAGVLVSAPSNFYELSEDGDTTKPGTLIEADKIANGTLFAVILQYKGASDGKLEDPANWVAVSGDSLSGWKTSPATSIGDIAQVAHSAGHPFELSTSGTYEVTIEELPGELTTYYNLIKATENGDVSKTKFTVAYYFTEGDLSHATGNNTHRLYIEGTDHDDKWNRTFSVNLQVPNIKNFLYVQKTDAEWNPIANGAGNENLSATFSLYTEDQVEANANGEPQLRDGAEAYDTVTTSKELMVGTGMGDETAKVMDSGASFPTGDKVLKEGVYYLAEDMAPDGYKRHTQLTKVVVTDRGVFADAGAAGDDVRVRTGVGHLVRTMARFATGDEIDATLRDITAQLMVSTKAPQLNMNDSDWQSHWQLSDPLEERKLSYGASNALLQYGLTGYEGDDKKDTFEEVTIGVDSGWSSLAIKQNFGTADGKPSNANKQNLGDTYLNRLFSESTTVQIANHAEGALKISKVVEGGVQETTPSKFTVEVNLWRDVKVDGQDKTERKNVSGTYSLAVKDADNNTIQGQPTTIEFDKDGKAKLTLQAGWTALIGGIDNRLCADKGYGYTVKEVDIPSSFVQKDGSPRNAEGPIVRATANEAADSNVVTVTNVYVLGFGIFKVDAADKTGLEGVEFELRDDLGGENNAGDSVYNPATDTKSTLYNDKSQTDKVVWPKKTNGSKEQRNFAVYGLQIGKSYWIVETKALDGYQLIKPVRFTVNGDGSLKFDYTNEPVIQQDGLAVITITNSKPPNLPQTGGSGNVPLYAAGTALIAGAAFALERDRAVRKSK